jgi:hypothetical protein
MVQESDEFAVAVLILASPNGLAIENVECGERGSSCHSVYNRASRVPAGPAAKEEAAQCGPMHQGGNPVRFVKFLPEDNLRFETLREAQERALLLASPPLPTCTK